MDLEKSKVELSRHFKAKIIDAFDSMSSSTLKAYKGDVLFWIRKTKDPTCNTFEQAIASIREMDEIEASANLRTIRDRENIAPATRARYVRSIRTIIRKLKQCGLIDYDLDNVKAPSIRSLKDTAGPPTDDIDKLLRHLQDCIDNGETLALRDLAVVLVLLDGALRRSELVSARIKDLNQDEAGAYISIIGKGRDERERAVISDRAYDALKNYLQIRRNWIPDHPLIAKRESNQEIVGRSIAFMLETRCNQIKIPIIRPHQLRHAGITRAVVAWKGDPFAIVRFARHKKADTTKIYVDNAADRAAQVANLIAKNDEFKVVKVKDNPIKQKKVEEFEYEVEESDGITISDVDEEIPF